MNKSAKSLFLLCLLFLAILLLSLVITRSQDSRSQASPSFSPWNIAVISDTHNLDNHINQTIFSQIRAQSPDIFFHVGDFGFNQYALKTGDYHYYPLKGILDILYRGQFPTPPANPAEVHIALGNHDVSNQPRPKKILESTYKNICLGQQASWSPAGQDNCFHYSQSEALPVWQSGFLPFNPEIVKNGFCQSENTAYNYTFSRGNIRFIILGHTYTDNRSAQKDWFNSQVCQSGNSSVSIAFIHELQEFGPDFLSSITCSHNLKLVIGGHTHQYSYTNINGIPALTMAGMAVSSQPDSCTPHVYPENDYLILNVNQSAININRIVWPNGQPQPNSPQLLLTVPGNFTSYSYPTVSPTSAPTSTTTSVPPTSFSTPFPTKIPLSSTPQATATPLSPTVSPFTTPTSSPTTTTTKIPTPTPLSVPGSTTLSVDISFAGIRPTISACFLNPIVDVSLVDSNQQADQPQSIAVTKTNRLNSAGETIYNLSFTTTKFTLGSSPSFFIKGPLHLTNKYGQDNQIQRYVLPSSQIKLQANHTLNFSNYPLLPGDINGDGQVDGLDFARVKISASDFSTTDYLSDLDGSCQVNNLDLSLLVKTLSTKSEQVY